MGVFNITYAAQFDFTYHAPSLSLADLSDRPVPTGSQHVVATGLTPFPRTRHPSQNPSRPMESRVDAHRYRESTRSSRRKCTDARPSQTAGRSLDGMGV
jgi:hypothetical protein